MEISPKPESPLNVYLHWLYLEADEESILKYVWVGPVLRLFALNIGFEVLGVSENIIGVNLNGFRISEI